MDPRGGYVSKILHVKMKESGPVGGGARARRAPPRSANGVPAITTECQSPTSNKKRFKSNFFEALPGQICLKI